MPPLSIKNSSTWGRKRKGKRRQKTIKSIFLSPHFFKNPPYPSNGNVETLGLGNDTFI